MKKLIVCAILIVSAARMYGQDSTQKKKIYKNEFGVDGTAFLRQFMMGDNGFSGNNTIYYLTYRRHFKSGNIRFGIGGNFSREEPLDKIAPYDFTNRSSIDLRLGWEWTSILSKRWRVYYGVDLKPSFGNYQRENNYIDNLRGIIVRSQQYALSPLLGFRFWLTERLSLTTESSFSIIYKYEKSTTYSRPQYLYDYNDRIHEVAIFYSSFSSPLSVIVTFDI